MFYLILVNHIAFKIRLKKKNSDFSERTSNIFIFKCVFQIILDGATKILCEISNIPNMFSLYQNNFALLFDYCFIISENLQNSALYVAHKIYNSRVKLIKMIATGNALVKLPEILSTVYSYRRMIAENTFSI